MYWSWWPCCPDYTDTLIRPQWKLQVLILMTLLSRLHGHSNKTTVKAINTDPDDLVFQTAGTLAARHAPGSVTVLTARTADRTWRRVHTRVASGDRVGVGLGCGDGRGDLGHWERWTVKPYDKRLDTRTILRKSFAGKRCRFLKRKRKRKCRWLFICCSLSS